jgi:hypothetical protein
MNHVLLVEHFVGKDGAVDNEFQNPNRLSDLCGRIGFWLDSGGEWALVKTRHPCHVMAPGPMRHLSSLACRLVERKR